jgi:hypothetical protein
MKTKIESTKHAGWGKIHVGFFTNHETETGEGIMKMKRIPMLAALAVAGMVFALAPAAQAALVEYEFTSNEGFTGSFTLDTANQIPSGPNFDYDLNPTSGIPLFDFFHPLNAANDFNQDDGGNACCMGVTTDGVGNLLSMAFDVDDVAGTSSGSFVFGSIDFMAGTGQIDGAPFLALTEVQWQFAGSASAIPEPSAFLLSVFGAAALGLLGWRRRRR